MGYAANVRRAEKRRPGAERGTVVGAMSGHGARRERHALDGSAGSIAEAREHARLFLAQCVPALSAAQARDALLAVSELATNAVRHAPGPYVLTLGDDGTAVTIAVTDGHRNAPAARRADIDAAAGCLLTRRRAGALVRRRRGSAAEAVLLRDGLVAVVDLQQIAGRL